MRRTRRSGNPLVRLGIFLVIIGFGSVILNSGTDFQFTLLVWADGAQPYIGIVVGLLGVGLLASPVLLRARQAKASAAQQTPFAQPQNFGQGFGQPPQGFAQPQGFAPSPQGFDQPPTGFPAPTGGFPPPAAPQQQYAQPQQFGVPPQGVPPQGVPPQGGQPPFGPNQQPGSTWPR